ncbi:MAG: hypothetical protein RLZZ326_4420 [Planctomycetota bacterium]
MKLADGKHNCIRTVAVLRWEARSTSLHFLMALFVCHGAPANDPVRQRLVRRSTYCGRIATPRYTQPIPLSLSTSLVHHDKVQVAPAVEHIN